MSVVIHKQIDEEQTKLLDRVFSHATFTAKPDTWFDAGTTPKLMQILYVVGPSIPTGLFAGIKDSKRDEETCSFDEFDVTWLDCSTLL